MNINGQAGSSGPGNAPATPGSESEQVGSKELSAYEDNTYYSIELSKNKIKATMSWSPVSGATNGYGKDVYVSIGNKRAKLEKEYWSVGWAVPEWGLQLDDCKSYGEVEYVSKKTAKEWINRFNKIEKINDEEKRNSEIVKLVKDIFLVFGDEYYEEYYEKPEREKWKKIDEEMDKRIDKELEKEAEELEKEDENVENFDENEEMDA